MGGLQEETSRRLPGRLTWFQGLDLFNGTQVAWHDFRALNIWLDKSWYPCLKQLCLRDVDKNIFSELARQWAKQCIWLWRLHSHLDAVQSQLGTTEGVQVKRKIQQMSKTKNNSGGTIETAMHIKTSSARKHERSSGCDNYIKDSSNIYCFLCLARGSVGHTGSLHTVLLYFFVTFVTIFTGRQGQ